MYSLFDIQDIRFRDLMGNVCLKKALLAIGTASGFKTTNAVDYSINGIVYAKAATDNVAMSANAGAVAQAAGTTRYYSVYLDSAGNFATKLCDASGDLGTLFGGPAPQSGGTTSPAGLWPSGMTKSPASVAITVITQAKPVQITAVSHGLQTGDQVQIAGIPAGGPQQLNGQAFSITKVDANNFTLDGLDGTTFPVYGGTGGIFLQMSQGLCCIGAIKVVNVTNPFIPGTTALNASGVTSTYVDFLFPPINPRP